MASYNGFGVSTEELLILGAVVAVGLWATSDALAAPVQDVTSVVPWAENQVNGFEHWLAGLFS